MDSKQTPSINYAMAKDPLSVQYRASKREYLEDLQVQVGAVSKIEGMMVLKTPRPLFSHSIIITSTDHKMTKQALKDNLILQWAVCHNAKTLCWFGRGIKDLLIADECNKNSNSKSELGFNFKHAEHVPPQSEDRNNWLAGSPCFKVSEIEVLRIERIEQYSTRDTTEI
ncbi:hypothetical protein FGO68_gene2611 [Halteria grandinella]|uniref:Uncharacterized protein n=1 Tax=Halteria grandinella TaxID=5974 RepID=A0A8J8NJS2_HALGN|nr:hypothetical protein FGO68_gene2611 [Halteria grandinella]